MNKNDEIVDLGETLVERRSRAIINIQHTHDYQPECLQVDSDVYKKFSVDEIKIGGIKQKKPFVELDFCTTKQFFSVLVTNMTDEDACFRGGIRTRPKS